MKLLAICIPTFNRAQSIRQQLSNLSRLIDYSNEIGIFISDNGSQDNTSIEITKFANDFPSLFSYHINESNLGFDANYKICCQHAINNNFKYCWILGDDDSIDFDYLDEILSLLRDNTYSLITLNARVLRKNSFEIRVKNMVSCQYLGFNSFFKDIGWHTTWISTSIPVEELKLPSSHDKSLYKDFIHIYIMLSAYNDKSKILYLNNCVVSTTTNIGKWTIDNSNVYELLARQLYTITLHFYRLNTISIRQLIGFLRGHSQNMSSFGIYSYIYLSSIGYFKTKNLKTELLITFFVSRQWVCSSLIILLGSKFSRLLLKVNSLRRRHVKS